MISFSKKIIQIGFGAVGKSFYEKVRKQIKFNDYNYFVISCNYLEFESYINMGGIAENFLVYNIDKDNFKQILDSSLTTGDILLDFADSIGTKDLIKYCMKKGIMYLNTGEADWPDKWYNIYEENKIKNDLKDIYSNYKNNKYPIVLQHGNNPGLVSHFVKSALEYIINTQFKNNKTLKQFLKDNKFNEIANYIGLKTIHVNDIDLQKSNNKDSNDTLLNTWCIDSFFFEMLSNATISIGSDLIINKNNNSLNSHNEEFVELKKLAIDTSIKSYYPGGNFSAYLVPHEETITIAKSLEVKNNNKVIYRPTVMFLYSPPIDAKNYFSKSKTNLLEKTNEENSVIRGYKYPLNSKILYNEDILSGTEYVGVLLIGDKFNPVWVGNKIDPNYLYKNKKNSYWQTPTITPVAISALAALCWMIKNSDKGNIYFPDDINDYKYILKIAEKYISKTIYRTIDKELIRDIINQDINDLLQ